MDEVRDSEFDRRLAVLEMAVQYLIADRIRRGEPAVIETLKQDLIALCRYGKPGSTSRQEFVDAIDDFIVICEISATRLRS
jgi:hypothetical protein